VNEDEARQKACGDMWSQSIILEAFSSNCPRPGKGSDVTGGIGADPQS